MNTKEILIAARAKVAQGWTQCASAENSSGHVTGTKCADARAWCAIGAINAVTDTITDANAAAWSLANTLGIGPTVIVKWNDTHNRTQAEVLAAFDRAIEACPD